MREEMEAKREKKLGSEVNEEKKNGRKREKKQHSEVKMKRTDGTMTREFELKRRG